MQFHSMHMKSVHLPRLMCMAFLQICAMLGCRRRGCRLRSLHRAAPSPLLLWRSMSTSSCTTYQRGQYETTHVMSHSCAITVATCLALSGCAIAMPLFSFVFHGCSPKVLQRLPRVALLLVKPLLQAVALLWLMLFRMPSPSIILLQVQ